MCNLYTQTTSREAARRLFKVRPEFDHLGNFQIEHEGRIYPDKYAPIVRTRKDGDRELVIARWGFPSPQLKGKPVTNARNLALPYWRGWLGKPEFRGLVPAEKFAEPHPTRKDARGWTDNEWFEMKDGEPFAFAGVWRPWTGERSIGNRKNETREWHLFAFLTCEPNELVAPIHSKAMPVILDPGDYDTWLTASWDEAKSLARPIPADEMRIAVG
jgi:putative SOS response-associated peptidase YedK